MKCANCDNTDTNTLWDEGDTIYCSKCCHRTRKEDGEDDLVLCPVCHHMRDRKALYCMWCNSAWGSDEYNSDSEDLATEFETSTWSNSNRYRKLKRK